MTSNQHCFLASNNVFEKLKLLNFQKEFQEKKQLSHPIFPDYFSLELNSSEQFLTFKILMKWLLQLLTNKNNFDFYDYSDPISVSSGIIDELKTIDIKLDIQPLKLKNGYGQEICEILNLTLDKIWSKKIRFNSPNFPINRENKDLDKNEEEDEEEDIVGSVNDDDDDDDLIAQEEIDQDKQIIETKGDEKTWFSEVEKNATKLNINNKIVTKEWRMHIEKSKICSDNLFNLKSKCSKILEKISDKINNNLDKINSSENTINNSLSNYSNKIKTKTDKKREINQKIWTLTERNKELEEENINLSDRNEQLQKRLKEKGVVFTNDEPLKLMKKTYSDLKKEIQFMDVKIGILNNLILQGNFQKKQINMEETLNSFGKFNNNKNNNFDIDNDIEGLEVLS